MPMSMPMPMMPKPMGMSGCTGGLEMCGGACVDVQRNTAHCGHCDKRCGNKQTCVAGKCEKADEKNPPVAMNDIVGLARILALFGLSLQDLANVKGVEVKDLAFTPITSTDLALLGIDAATLGIVGLGLETLALIGIEISLK